LPRLSLKGARVTAPLSFVAVVLPPPFRYGWDMADLDFIHRFMPATKLGLPPLLLLHGTGGDENDLLPLGEAISPGSALLSPRGKVLERGMPRFFRRLAEGVFDLDDLKARTAELAAFVKQARASYSLDPVVALGFSNGANIAASLLLSQPDVLAGAILLRAMLPFEPETPPILNGKPVLMISGAADPFIPAASSERLAELLTECGAALTHHTLDAGHNLTQNDLAIAARWLEQVDGRTGQ
jgi:phospholipase/carboxylesterase